MHAEPSPPMPCVSSFMCWPITLGISCGRWRYPDGRGRSVAAHVQGHPDAYCPAPGAARTRRERCKDRMRQTTTAGVRHHKGKGTSFMRQEAGTYRFRCPRHPSLVRAFCHGRPKTRQWRSPVPRFGEKCFPKCELPHTSRTIPDRCCLRVGGSGAHLANAGLIVLRRSESKRSTPAFPFYGEEP